MKTRFAGESDAEFADASPYPLIRPVEVVVPVQAPVHGGGELRRQRVTNREPAAAERHVVPMHHVLLHALRVPADVHHPPVVVLPQHRRQILREEHRVVVAHHEPPHVRQPRPEQVHRHPRDPHRRFRPRRAPEPLPLRRHPAPDPRPGLPLLIQEHEPLGQAGFPPEIRIQSPVLPRPGRAAYAEGDVGDVCGGIIGVEPGHVLGRVGAVGPAEEIGSGRAVDGGVES